MIVFAIDPGPTRSAWVLLADGSPIEFGLAANDEVLPTLEQLRDAPDREVVIEKVESFGMPVGVEVFETVFWSGRFAQAVGGAAHRIGRKTIKLHLCGSMRAKDPNIRQALIDRFTTDEQPAIGTTKKRGPLYGMSGDIWSALAVAVTWSDQHS